MHLLYYISEFGLGAQVGCATVLRSYTHARERTAESLEQTNTNVLFGYSHTVILFLSLPAEER